MSTKKSILDVLAERPVVGDGSYVNVLEKRGYVKAGPWTPEAVIEYPEAVQELHREFLRAGSDILQAFTFYAADGKLVLNDNSKTYSATDISEAACRLVEEIARPAGVIICGGISPTPTYKDGKGDAEEVRNEFRKQKDTLSQHVDFLLAEFFGHIGEMELAISVLKESGLPVAATLRMGPTGDLHGVTPQQCAVRMAKAGADIIGLNCQYDPSTCIKTMKMMKEGLDAAGLSPYLMLQPLAFHCPDCEHAKQGWMDLPEFPFALEPRLLTRWDVRRYVREALALGVRYIGGCCGFEPYHIREIAEELAELRGFRPLGKDKHIPFGGGNAESVFPFVRDRSTEAYWMGLKPASGRPQCPLLTTPEQA